MNNFNIHILSISIPFKWKYVFASIFLIISTQSSFADDFYWVGGTGKWSDFNNHWMKESGGDTTQGRIPTFKDNVFFDENSFDTKGQSVQLDIIVAEVKDFDFSGIQDSINIELIPGGRDLTIFGSMKLNELLRSSLPNLIVASNTNNSSIDFLGVFMAKTITFSNTQLLEIITGNRKICKVLEKTGVGTIILKDSLKISNSIVIENGRFISGGNYIKTSRFLGEGSNTRINLQNSHIDVNNWDMDPIKSFSSNSSIISVTNPKQGIFHGANLTYYDVFLCGKISVQGNSTFHEFDICEGSDIELKAGTTQNISQLIAKGTPGNPIRISSNIFESEAYIQQNSGEVVAISINLEDIHAKGSATFNATNSVEFGNVVGWNIVIPQKKLYYWVGGSGNWSDFNNHWATSSGGNKFHDALPTIYDDVIFDERSFAIPSEINIDLYHAYCEKMDWRGIDAQVIFKHDEEKIVKLHVFGSFYFSKRANSTLSYIRFKTKKNEVVDSQGSFLASNLDFYHTGKYSILAHSNLLAGSVNLNRPGTTEIKDTVLLSSNLNMQIGELIINDAYISVPDIRLNFGVVDIQRSEIVTRSWNASNELKLVSNLSLIRVESQSYGAFNGGSLIYYDVILCGRIYVSGENVYHKLEFCPGSDIYLPANQSQKPFSLIVNGDPGFPISISSSIEGQQAEISLLSGSVVGQYLYLNDSKASGGVFTATGTVDLGNVEGWDISSPSPDNYFWVGGPGSWTDYETHWATTSGGTVFHDRIPGALDDVVFDSKSFETNDTDVNINLIKTYTKHLDFSGVNSSFNLKGGIEVWVYGSMSFNEMGNSDIELMKFPTDTANFQISSKGKYLASRILFDHVGNYDLGTSDKLLSKQISMTNIGEVNLNGNLKLGLKLEAKKGNFKTNNYNMEIPVIDYGYSSGNAESEINFDIGSSTVTVSSWLIGDRVSFHSDSSEINVFSGSGRAYFYGGGNDYNKVNAACIVYFKDNNHYEKLTFTYGAKVFIKGEQSVNDLIAIGTSGNPIRISGGSFRKSSGKVINQYLILNNSKAVGGAEFIAERSTDDGGNKGWQILSPVENIDANVLDILKGEPLCGEAIETILSIPAELLTTVQWYKNGVPINSDSSSLAVREEGNYYVQVTNACGTIAQSNVIEIRREGPPNVPTINKDGISSICGDQVVDVKLNTDKQPRVHYLWLRNNVVVGEDEPNFAIDTVGTYTLRLTKGECVVDSKDSVIVIKKDGVPKYQALQLTGNDTICLGDSSRLIVPYEPGTTYGWHFADTTIFTQINYFDIDVEETYTLELENGCGVNAASGAIFLSVKEIPKQQQIFIKGEDTFCYYDSVNLSIPVEPEVSYQWMVNDANLVNNFSNNEAFTDTAGQYYVVMKNICGVVNTDKVKISHIYLPKNRDILIERDTIFCIGDSVIFSLVTNSIESWTWMDRGKNIIENDERIIITEPGLFSAEISNICGTTKANNIISVEVKDIPPETVVKDFYEICGPGDLTINVDGGEEGNYIWRDEKNQIIHGLNSSEIIVPLNVSKDYFVTLSNGYCEGPGKIVDINVLEIPVADAGEDKIVIYGDDEIIGGEHDVTTTNYIWSPDVWMNNFTSPTPTIRPEKNIIYTVEAVGENRCSSFDDVNITVSFELVIPNTFTPNNDGTNDVWFIRNIMFHEDSKVEIFNRWGTKLYETVGYKNDWDGTYNGKKLPVDTYFYVIQFNDGAKPNKGSLTILR